MRKLIFRLLIFWLPVLVPTLFIYSTGYYIGETMPLQTVVSTQQNADHLVVFLPTWQHEEYMHYKLLSAQMRQADILVFGSSRMLYFSENFVANGVLYNASVAGTPIDYQVAMLRTLIEADTLPDLILLGIDLTSYNDALPTFEPSRTEIVSLNNDTNYQVNGFREVIGLWWSGEMPMLMNQSRPNEDFLFLGSRAINSSYGLLRDGSTYASASSADPQVLADNLARSERDFENADTHFTRGDTVNQANMAFLSDFLALADAHEISVIGLTQPFHPYFVEQMRDNPEFAYRDLAQAEIEALFAEYDFPFYDFPDIESYGGTVEDFLDDWHYRQLASLQIFTLIAAQSQDILGEYVDMAQLEQDIANADNPYSIYYPAP